MHWQAPRQHRSISTGFMPVSVPRSVSGSSISTVNFPARFSTESPPLRTDSERNVTIAMEFLLSLWSEMDFVLQENV